MKGSKYQVAAKPDWVLSTQYQSNKSLDEHSPFSFLLVDYQELITEDKTFQYYRTVEKVNDASRIEDASLFISEIEDDEHLIIFHSIDIIREDKCIHALNVDEILETQRETSLERHITDQRLTVSVSIDDLRVGDIVDYQATHVVKASEHPFKGKYYRELFRLNWTCPVYKQHIRIINESKREILAQYDTLESGKFSTKTKPIAIGQTLLESFTDLEVRPIEDTSPYWLWPNAIIVTSKTSWLELSSYLYSYYETQKGLFESIDPSTVEGISLGGNKAENIVSIIRFVQNEIRYKGENQGVFSHTPKSPSHTLKKRYGDCKDKSNLLVGLLKYINVEAYLTLVNSNYGLKIGHLNPSPYHFNHMIVCIRVDGQEYYFDPTIKKEAGNLMSSVNLDYGYGLILTKKGSELKKIPYSITNDVFLLEHFIDFTETIDGVGTLTISRTFYKHRANNIRYYLSSNDSKKLEKEYLESAEEVLNVKLKSLEPFSLLFDDTDKNIIKVSESYIIVEIPNDKNENQIHIPTDIYLEFPTSRRRDQPLRIDLDGRITHKIEAKYKGDAASYSDSITIQNRWFSYDDQITTKGDTVYLSAVATPSKQYVHVEDLDTYIEDVEKVYSRHMNNLSTIGQDVGNYNKLGTIMFIVAALLVILTTFNQ